MNSPLRSVNHPLNESVNRILNNQAGPLEKSTIIALFKQNNAFYNDLEPELAEEFRTFVTENS